MKNFLARLSSKNKEYEYQYLKEIPDSEFRLILINFAVIEEVQHLMDLFLLLRFNFEDIVEFQENDVIPIIQEVNPVSHITEHQHAYLKAQINRFVNNYLSSFRMFIDHVDIKIGRRFDKKSKEYSSFITMTNKAFDNNFSYRFLYKLRNFCQHCGLPITSFQVEGLDNGSSFTFSFERDYLLNEYDGWSQKVKIDLKNGPKQIPINPILSSHFKIVSEFSKRIHTLYESKFMSALEYLRTVVSDYRGEEELVILSEGRSVNGNKEINIVKFPWKLIDEFNNR